MEVSYFLSLLRLFIPIFLFWVYFKFRTASSTVTEDGRREESVSTQRCGKGGDLLWDEGLRKRKPQTDTVNELQKPKALSENEGTRSLTPDEAALVAQMQAAASYYRPQSPSDGAAASPTSPIFLQPSRDQIKGYSLAKVFEALTNAEDSRKIAPTEMMGLSLLDISEVVNTLKEQRKKYKQIKKKKTTGIKSDEHQQSRGAEDPKENGDLVAQMVEQCTTSEDEYLKTIIQISVNKLHDNRCTTTDFQNILLASLKFKHPSSSKVVRFILEKSDAHRQNKPEKKPLIDACLYELAIRCALTDTTLCPEGDLELAADLLRRMEVQIGPGAEPMQATMDLIMTRYKQYSQSYLTPAPLSSTPSEVGSEGLPSFPGIPDSTTQLQRAAARREGKKTAKTEKFAPFTAGNTCPILMAPDLNKEKRPKTKDPDSATKWNTNAPVFMPAKSSAYWTKNLGDHSAMVIQSCPVTPDTGKPLLMLGETDSHFSLS